MRKLDRFTLIGGILMVVSPFLPFWAGASVIGGVYDMWVGAPSVNYYGLSDFGPNVTVDMGWTTWIDVIMLTLGVALIFAAGITGIFKSTIGGFFGAVSCVMILFSFIGFPQITYFWVWALMGPAFFLMCIGVVICLLSLRRSRIRFLLTQGKRVFILPVVVILLASLLIVSVHVQTVVMENEINYFDDNLNNFLLGKSNIEDRRTFLLSLDNFIQERYRELPRFVEYSSAVGHGLGWGNFQGWSLVRLIRARVQSMLREINETTVDSGAIVWRIYNEGFIVKTRNLTLGFDIACTWLCPEIAGIADHADLLFMSHRHGDHADIEGLKRASLRGVKTVIPEPDLEEPAWYVTQLQQNASQLVPASVEQPINVSGVQVRAFLTPHGITNYAYLVELPDGLRILHTGDTEHFSDLTWIDDLANEQQIDIAFLKAGSLTDIPREAIKIPILARRHEKLPLGRPFSETALKPKIIVPMHENELGHGFAWISTSNLHLAYQQLDELNSSTTQIVVLAWGQSIFL
ncbi:MAG: MBL fold metallo-hydrolase [Candidatus Bathyarchaeia archaeon]